MHKQIIENLLLGKYEEELVDELSDAISALHDGLGSVEELKPLLDSDHESAVYAGCYIAQEEGIRSKPIFSRLIELLNTSFIGVKCEICSCFSICAEPLDYFELGPSFSDENQSVRLHAIMAMQRAGDGKILEMREYISEKHEYFREGLNIYAEHIAGLSSSQEFFEHFKEWSKVTSIFSYCKPKWFWQ